MSVVEINPDRVYFTFSRIRPVYSCGRSIEDTLNSIRNKELTAQQLPQITLLTDGTNYFSLNNRRLFTFKQLKSEGLLQTIKARVKAIPNTKRMDGKYTPEKCSLIATLMRVQKAGEEAEAEEEGEQLSEDDFSEDEDEGEKGEKVEVVAETKEKETPKIHTVLKHEGAMTTEKRQAVSFGAVKDNIVVEIAANEKPEPEFSSEKKDREAATAKPKARPGLFTEKMLRSLNKKEKKAKPHLFVSDGKRKAKKKEAKFQQQSASSQHMSNLRAGNGAPEADEDSEDEEEEEEEEEEEVQKQEEKVVKPQQKAQQQSIGLSMGGGFGALAGKKRRR